MKILLVVATGFEIKELIENYFFLRGYTAQGNKNFHLKINQFEIDILITGPGINNTAYYMGNMFANHTFDICLNAGICGSFNRSIAIGEVVNIQTEAFAQLGAEDGNEFIDIFKLQLMEDHFPFKNEKLMNENIINLKCLRGIKKVDGITVETVPGNERSILQIKERLNPDVESMEGAAFFNACLLNNVPFLQLRSVSNYVERRNKENWNIPLAVSNLNNLLIQLLNEVTA